MLEGLAGHSVGGVGLPSPRDVGVDMARAVAEVVAHDMDVDAFLQGEGRPWRSTWSFSRGSESLGLTLL